MTNLTDPDVEHLQRRLKEFARTVESLTNRFDEKVEELSFVRNFGDALGRCRTSEAVAKNVVTLVDEVFFVERSALFLTDRNRCYLRSMYSAETSQLQYFEAHSSPTMISIGDGVVGETAASVKMLRHDELVLENAADEWMTTVGGSVSVLSIPLCFAEKVIGVLVLFDTQSHTFNERHERLMAIAANSIAQAFETAFLFEQVSQSQTRLLAENQALKEKISGEIRIEGLIGEHPKFQQALSTMGKVANTNVTVLISGESGTGKELFARALHHESTRRSGPFVAINCGALPESLLEAELFGIEKGIATGVDARAGTFEKANRGTLFLDEVGDMPLSVQVRLLRVLQERQVVRVGSTKPMDIDVRVVAATHRSLADEIEKGKFRQDLYYRLKVVTIEVPALRDRPSDIVELSNFFLHRFSALHGRAPKTLSIDAARALMGHGWPGNVRELEHAVEQAYLLSDGSELEPQDFGLIHSNNSALSITLPDRIECYSSFRKEAQMTLERLLLERVLASVNNNRSKAAERLNLSRRSLHYKLKSLGLS